MIRGFYTAASGMLTYQRRNEILTNNLGNVNTPGYKANATSVRAFPEMLMKSFGGEAAPNKGGSRGNNILGTMNTGVYVQETIPTFLQGAPKETNVATDIAIMDQSMPLNGQSGKPGTVLFTVENASGEQRYTRNGSFTISTDGYLTTKDGYYVLNETNERIKIDSDNFRVAPNGEVTDMNGNKGRIAIRYAENPYDLEKDETGLYRIDGNQLLPLASEVNGARYSIMQGFVEGSNVDLNQTMTDLMTGYRAFESSQRMLQAIDKTLEKTVNEIGRVR